MDLKEYEQRKFHLAEIIRSAQAIDTNNTELNGDCRELLARLAEDQFNLMVVGRFSRGKSTLMNAILGGDYLPTGFVPLTSVITTVRYGSRPQVVLHFRDSGFNREVPLSQLDEYVTQKGNPGNAKKIAWAEIQLPVEILRRGFLFVDTPGLGSPIVENTLTTERFLPQADAFILVTSYESPISEEEDRILERIRNSGKPLFAVLNKRDTVTQTEREQARSFVINQLTMTLGRPINELYSISARQALAAKVAQNQPALEESGVPAFEHDLLRFLAEDRAQSFLEGMYQRTLELLSRWSRPSDDQSHEAEWAALLQRLLNQHASITGIQGHSSASTEIGSPGNEVWKLRIDRKAGCSICGSVLEATFRFLSKYQYDLTIRPEVQQEHAKRNGFCPLHTWQYEGISSPYGVCTAYPSLAHSVASQLNQIAVGGSSSERHIDELISTYQTCPACEVRRRAEEQAVADAAESISWQSAGAQQVDASSLPGHAPLTAEQVIHNLAQMNLHRDRALHAYHATRTYQVEYRGLFGTRNAEMVVGVTYLSPGRKEFVIQSETGSKLIIDKVLKKLLEAEREESRPKIEQQSALTDANYRFTLIGHENGFSGDAYVLEVEPRRKDKFLYHGRIWVDAGDFAVVRLKAEPTENPSFWTRKADINEVYTKVRDFWLPASNHSVTAIRLGGHADLTIEYTNYEITDAEQVTSLAAPPTTLTAETARAQE